MSVKNGKQNSDSWSRNVRRKPIVLPIVLGSPQIFQKPADLVESIHCYEGKTKEPQLDSNENVEILDSEALQSSWREQVSVGQMYDRYWQDFLKSLQEFEHMCHGRPSSIKIRRHSIKIILNVTQPITYTQYCAGAEARELERTKIDRSVITADFITNQGNEAEYNQIASVDVKPGSVWLFKRETIIFGQLDIGSTVQKSYSPGSMPEFCMCNIILS